jgi:hypothetical protein
VVGNLHLRDLPVLDLEDDDFDRGPLAAGWRKVDEVVVVLPAEVMVMKPRPSPSSSRATCSWVRSICLPSVAKALAQSFSVRIPVMPRPIGLLIKTFSSTIASRRSSSTRWKAS